MPSDRQQCGGIVVGNFTPTQTQRCHCTYDTLRRVGYVDVYSVWIFFKKGLENQAGNTMFDTFSLLVHTASNDVASVYDGRQYCIFCCFINSERSTRRGRSDRSDKSDRSSRS